MNDASRSSEPGRRRGTRSYQPADIKYDLMYDSRTFLMFVPLPLAVSVGCFVTLMGGGEGGARELAWAPVGLIGGPIIAGAYLIRYVPMQGWNPRLRTLVVVVARVVWLSWFAVMAVLWFLGRD